MTGPFAHKKCGRLGADTQVGSQSEPILTHRREFWDADREPFVLQSDAVFL
jgi:hypothetical protein